MEILDFHRLYLGLGKKGQMMFHVNLFLVGSITGCRLVKLLDQKGSRSNYGSNSEFSKIQLIYMPTFLEEHFKKVLRNETSEHFIP